MSGGALGVWQSNLNNVGEFVVLYASPTSFTAYPGGGKTYATRIITQVATVGTVATAADSVLLYPATRGLMYYITNAGANDMQVFGDGADTINGVAAATGISQPAGSTYTYICNSAGAWVTTPTTGTFITGTFNAIVGGDSSLGITGQSTAQGGAIALVGGTSSTSGNAGGAITSVGGTPGATGVGGAVTMTGGAGGATSGAGGAVSMTGGAGTNGNAIGGAASVVAGAGQGTAAGGAVAVTGGASGAGATGNGGAVTVTGGAAASTNGTGGASSLIGGAGTGTGNGGAVAFTGGASGAGATGNGGAATQTGGAALSTNGTGGAAGMVGGAGAGNGAGGAITITSGAAGATGVAGAVNISVGGATSGNGSAVTITGGAGAGGTNSGGNVNIVPGAAVSTGTPGEFQVNSVAGSTEATWQQFLAASVPVSGTSYTFFMANRAYRCKAASVICSSSATVPTVDITKDTGTTAPGGGTSILTGVITFSGTANTRVTGTLTSTVATLTLAAGDRLAAKWGGTVGSITGGMVSVLLVPC